MCVCIHTHTYVCIYIYIYVYMCVYIHVNMYMYTHTYICTYLYVCECNQLDYTLSTFILVLKKNKDWSLSNYRLLIQGAILLRINKSICIFLFLFFPHPVERSKLHYTSLKIWACTETSVPLIPPTLPSPALYHQGKVINFFVIILFIRPVCWKVMSGLQKYKLNGTKGVHALIVCVQQIQVQVDESKTSGV